MAQQANMYIRYQDEKSLTWKEHKNADNNTSNSINTSITNINYSVSSAITGVSVVEEVRYVSIMCIIV